MELSLLLQKTICDNGLNQTTFAKAINATQAQVSEWLKGKSKPGYDSIKAICLALDISADRLLGLDEK